MEPLDNFPVNPQTGTELRRLQRRQTLLWLLVLLLCMVFVWPTLRGWLGFGTAGTPRPVAPRGDLSSLEKSTVQLFEAVSPSVVYINTRSRVASPWSRLQVQEVESGTGSGFVWDESGHIVTNFHVIQNASSAVVVMKDQTRHEAELVGASPDHDLAVLRIRVNSAQIRPVLIGESSTLAVGQSAFAIGNPFGLSQTLTTGIISAKSRTIQGPSGRPIEDVIQIDAAINVGNSGGPLLDSAGRLIGVNTAIYSPSGTSAGVGFAIPVDTVNRVVPQLIAKGNYNPPRMGVAVNDEVSRAITQELGIPGVVVFKVEPNSGAADAGLKGLQEEEGGKTRIGDIIQKVEGRSITNFNELQASLESLKAGDKVRLELFRNGKTETVEVELR